jgi:outer membrane lipase/esterase
MTHISIQRLMGACALALASLLSACGGASTTVDPLVPTRIIAFGDGLSAVDVSGKGIYTIQTGETDTTVASRIALRYNIILTTASAGVPLDPLKKGFSYAAGNAKVSDAADQITAFLTDNNSAIGPKDLFIITVGNRDIFENATGAGGATAVATAANLLAAKIQALTNAGAKYVLVMQPLNMARTPSGASSGVASTMQALSYDTGTLCESFSCQLTTVLQRYYPPTSAHQPVLLADLMAYFNLLTGTTSTGSINTYINYGVTNPDVEVCTTALPNCTSTTITSSTNPRTNAVYDYATSIFADGLNLTPMANRLLADYIYTNTMYRAGWR